MFSGSLRTTRRRMVIHGSFLESMFFKARKLNQALSAISNPRPAQAQWVAGGAELGRDLRGSDSAINIAST